MDKPVYLFILPIYRLQHSCNFLFISCTCSEADSARMACAKSPILHTHQTGRWSLVASTLIRTPFSCLKPLSNITITFLYPAHYHYQFYLQVSSHILSSLHGSHINYNLRTYFLGLGMLPFAYQRTTQHCVSPRIVFITELQYSHMRHAETPLKRDGKPRCKLH
jgi:hypothetical protein